MPTPQEQSRSESRNQLLWGIPGFLNDTGGYVAHRVMSQVPGATPTTNNVSGPIGMIAGMTSALQGMMTLSSNDPRTGHERTDANVNGTMQILNGLLTGAGGVATMAQNMSDTGSSPTAGRLGQAAGVVESLQGLYNIASNHGRSDERRPDGTYSNNAQTESDGVFQLLHGGASTIAARTNNPYVLALQAGLTVGNAAVTQADGIAERNGMFGFDPFSRNTQRGAHAHGPVTPSDNASGSEDAANAGARTFQRVSGNTFRDGLWGTGLFRGNDTASTVIGHLAGGSHAIGAGIANTGRALWRGLTSVF